MATVEVWLQQYGTLMVYLNALVDAAGLLIPSFPLLLLSDAMLDTGGAGALPVMAAALAGALTADLIWYQAPARPRIHARAAARGRPGFLARGRLAE